MPIIPSERLSDGGKEGRKEGRKEGHINFDLKVRDHDSATTAVGVAVLATVGTDSANSLGRRSGVCSVFLWTLSE